MSPKNMDYIEEAHKRAEARETHVSFPQLKYPSLRDERVRDPARWLEGKVMDDGAEGLWRVNDGIYDLTRFIKSHPGGEDWLLLTKGTDITEAFESHHLNPSVETILKKYYVRSTTAPRNSPFTFEKNGFYKTLKIIVLEELQKLPKSTSKASAMITDSIFGTLLMSSVASCLVSNTYFCVVPLIVASLSLCWLTICGHNYLHHKDNWRMYLFNLSMTSYRDFRISHALSHHQFPNTLMDLEISGFDQVYPWLPRRDKNIYSKFAIIVELFTFPFLFFGAFLRKIILTLTKDGFYKKYWSWFDLLGFLLPAWMLVLSGKPFSTVIILWIFIVLGASFLFYCIGFNAAHHHPSIFHDGDEPRGATVDWGLHQLEAVMDRTDINGSLFKVMTHFGDHALHHLFPTVDHAALAHLYPVFLKHCTKYEANFRMTTQLDLIIGQVKQLLKTDPTVLKKK